MGRQLTVAVALAGRAPLLLLLLVGRVLRVRMARTGRWTSSVAMAGGGPYPPMWCGGGPWPWCPGGGP